MDRAVISIDQARKAVGVSRRTIYQWIGSGKVEHLRTAGGRIRIFEDSLWRDGSGRRPASAPAPDAKPIASRTVNTTTVDTLPPLDRIPSRRLEHQGQCPSCRIRGGGHLRDCPARMSPSAAAR